MAMEKKGWKKEFARDFLALGSWMFLVLISVRLLLLPHRWSRLFPLLYPFLIAIILVLILEFFVKDKIDYYISRAIILGFFVALFYKDNWFNGFVVAILFILLASSWYIGNSWKKINFGFLLGVFSIGLGLLVGGWLG